MSTTILMYNDGRVIERTGTSAMTVTAIREGEHVEVQMEFDMKTKEECTALVGGLLTQLEELHGENLVAQCIAHYAADTGKVIRRQGKRDLVWIKGHKDGRR